MNTSPYDNLLAGVHTELYIGGKWRAAAGGPPFDGTHPGPGAFAARVASGSVEDAKAAVDAAAAAGPAWAARKPRERGEILRKAFELIMRDAERIAKLMTLENGKSLTDARAE